MAKKDAAADIARHILERVAAEPASHNPPSTREFQNSNTKA